MITAIIAISKNFAIGKNGKLPWHYPADLKFFKETTTGHAIAMGSNTWRSIGRPLPNRLNLVLSRDSQIDLSAGVVRLAGKTEAVELSRYLAGDLYLLGGAQVYADFADVIDRWLVTFVPETVEDADTFMPRDFLYGFDLEGELEIAPDLVVKTFRRGNASGV
jgi:dihydrofolate reductase